MPRGYYSSDYLLLNKQVLSERINRLVKIIEESEIRFHAIAYRGHSGALVAPTVAHLISKELILVRSTTQGTHTDHLVEGYTNQIVRYVIIDDLLQSGRTINIILRRVKEFSKQNDFRCVGVFLYKSCNAKCELEGFREMFSWDFPIIVANTDPVKRIG